jgi:hypothetical protein
VFFHPTTGLFTLSCPARFPFSSYLIFHVPTVATTLLHVRIVLAVFDRSIMTALLSTTWDRLALGL